MTSKLANKLSSFYLALLECSFGGKLAVMEEVCPPCWRAHLDCLDGEQRPAKLSHPSIPHQNSRPVSETMLDFQTSQAISQIPPFVPRGDRETPSPVLEDLTYQL